MAKTLLFLPLGYSLAWLSEFSSIHWGFPYGDYFYIPSTLDRELWVLGVPFMDSLSYVFLVLLQLCHGALYPQPAPASAKTGHHLSKPASLRRSPQTLILGAFLFVLLDIIIDPVAFQGDRWFLGQIYGYREPGLYFGIPMSNFGGWLLVGLAMIAVLQLLGRLPLSGTRERLEARRDPLGKPAWTRCSTSASWSSTLASPSGSGRLLWGLWDA